MKVAPLGEQSSLPDISGEMVLQNKLEFELDSDDEIFQGYGKKYDTYPYRKYNTYSRKLKEKLVKTAVLENNNIKAVFC